MKECNANFFFSKIGNIFRPFHFLQPLILISKCFHFLDVEKKVKTLSVCDYTRSSRVINHNIFFLNETLIKVQVLKIIFQL